MKWMKGMSAVRATTGALVGQVGHLFGTDGEVYDAVLEIDTQPSIFSSASMLKPGRRHDAKVRLASADAASSAVRSVCIKVADVYGLGRDQDFLLASSGDGAPLHHCALPVAQESSSLYSSLWLYLVGAKPMLFGVQTNHGGLKPGADAAFSISAPIEKFRRIGTLTLGHLDETAKPPVFAARNNGGNIRPLPPVNWY